MVWVLVKFLFGKFIVVNVFFWGVLFVCMVVVIDFVGLMVMWFFLGLFEVIIGKLLDLVIEF